MALPQWTALSGTKLADIDERRNISIPLPLVNTSGITVRVIAGKLPPGLRIESFAIQGVPFEVNRSTDYEFTLRATSTEGVLDRTFTITVNGEDAPVWLTPEGVLNIGAKPTGEYWVDLRNTSWGMFKTNGINNFVNQSVTVSEIKLGNDVGANGDYNFVTGEEQFYYKHAGRWRRMSRRQLQSSVGFDTEIFSGSTIPQANLVDFWFNTNLALSGLDLKLRVYDDSLEQWVPRTYFTGFVPPPTPGNGTVWLQTYEDNLAYTAKVFNAGENAWQVLNIQYSNTAPANKTTAFFVLDSTIVDFQLQALDTDLSAGENLRYYIADDEGELPPGLRLTEDGKIVGIVEPLLALDKDLIPGYATNAYDTAPLDFSVVDDNGYDSYLYDTTFYEFATTTRRPKKLNRYYNFTVTVADDVSESKRDFSIYLVGDDFLRADNTIMKSATGLFTADVTFLRSPVFLTPGNLGVRRASNYQTFYIEVLDPNSLLGVLSYRLLPINDDGSPSELPPGMALDGITGEIAGIVPYQPAVSKDYRFTIEALRQVADVDAIEINANIYEDTLSGQQNIKLFKVNPVDFSRLVGQQVLIGNFNYEVTAVDDSNTEYDVITLDSTLEPIGIYQPLTVFETATPSRDWVYVNDIPERDVEFYKNKTLNFSLTEKYTIQFNTSEELYRRPTPFIRYSVSISDSSGALEFNYDAAGTPVIAANLFDATKNYMALLLSNNGISFDAINDIRLVSETENELVFDVVSNAVTRNRSNITRVFHGTDSSMDNVNATILNSFIKLYFDTSLTRTLLKNNQYTIGAVARANIVSRLADTDPNLARSVKTFSVRILGEVESTITWKTSALLPTQVANRTSYLRLEAETTLVGANLRYDLIGGRLPNGLELKRDGEIVGKINQYGSQTSPGLTTIDNRSTTFDGSTTTLDREFKFTVVARDRFGYSATMREFTLRITDVDDKVYTNVYMQPFVKPYQKENFLSFVNDYAVFTPSYIYRPSDPNFGIQKNLRTLAYAGIETKIINYFVAAVAKNHRKKRFNFGDLKIAVAKQPGTNEVVYEVVYVEIVDPQEPTVGETALSYKIQTTNPQKVNELKYEVKDDVTSSESSGDSFIITPRIGDPIRVSVTGNTIIVGTRTVDRTVSATGQIEIVLQNGNVIVVRSVSFTTNVSNDPMRYRPNGNVITADSNAMRISQNTDNLKYISNISNMRKRIAEIGVNERQFLPLWMRTSQDGAIEEIDYVTAMPICYCKPGTAQLIRENIVNAGFDFKTIDYEIDRYIIDSLPNSQQERFILFANYKFNV
jgi:hypothetical protein